MKNPSALDELGFDMSGGNYSELADALESWAEDFYLENLEDAYSDEIAYLLYNMSKEMRNISNSDKNGSM